MGEWTLQLEWGSGQADANSEIKHSVWLLALFGLGWLTRERTVNLKDGMAGLQKGRWKCSFKSWSGESIV